ncbi:hypothetical protein [uncultured Clostridium sp.]|uniref:hypothetical protein n=1 Tax=uncultured Clostridium sp. TaxID=59620 RepID=UPI0026374BB4|nr:hypothetical protein [uncultured Clostridium sp.]
MKKIVNALGMVMSVVSTIVIICTFLTSYQFIFLGNIFSTYLTLQVCIALTMILWGMKFWMEEFGRKKYIYPFICGCISLSSIFFIFSSVR